MRTVGAYEAKTHLSSLLEDVARGETITITKHGVPVARLVPATEVQRRDVKEVIEGLRQLREQVRPLDGLSLREMIEEDR